DPAGGVRVVARQVLDVAQALVEHHPHPERPREVCEVRGPPRRERLLDGIERTAERREVRERRARVLAPQVVGVEAKLDRAGDPVVDHLETPAVARAVAPELDLEGADPGRGAAVEEAARVVERAVAEDHRVAEASWLGRDAEQALDGEPGLLPEE